MEGKYTVSLAFQSESEARQWFESARSNGCINSDYGLRQATGEEMPSGSDKVHFLATESSSRSTTDQHNWIVSPEEAPETA